jgi:hypothetical protein
VTIGVYGFTVEAFLEKLTGGGVGLLLDLRQHRGVRGPDYSWANSARLQCALAAADIGYRHVKELAPTTELRRLTDGPPSLWSCVLCMVSIQQSEFPYGTQKC